MSRLSGLGGAIFLPPLLLHRLGAYRGKGASRHGFTVASRGSLPSDKIWHED